MTKIVLQRQTEIDGKKYSSVMGDLDSRNQELKEKVKNRKQEMTMVVLRPVERLFII